MDTDTEPRIIELRQDKSGAASFFFALLFIVWGWGGLLVALFSVVNAMSTTGVGVGTSAYVTMGLTFWIGGMVLLGLSVMLGGRRNYVVRYSNEYPEIFGDFRYRYNLDGSVAVLTAKGPQTYRSWKEFVKTIKKPPAS